MKTQPTRDMWLVIPQPDPTRPQVLIPIVKIEDQPWLDIPTPDPTRPQVLVPRRPDGDWIDV